MTIRSLGLASDLMVLSGLSRVETHDDRFVVRTPAEPDFWYGNMVIFRDERIDPARQIARFEADFSQAGHVTLGWDAPEMRPGPQHAALVAMGFEIHGCDVLALTGPLQAAAPPEDLCIRPLDGDEDWARATALQIETGIEEGHAEEMYRPFAMRRMTAQRGQVAQGRGVWFGAFDGAALVGDLGMFADARTARFQAVETRASHRRRGICAALLTAGVAWAARHRPGAVPVIVADAGSAAGRVYRHCGFALSETMVTALRPPG